MQKINIPVFSQRVPLSPYSNILYRYSLKLYSILLEIQKLTIPFGGKPKPPKTKATEKERRGTAKKSHQSSLIYTRQRTIRVDSQVRLCVIKQDFRNWHRREIVSPRSRPPPRGDASLTRNNTGRDYKSHGLFLNRVQKFLRIYSAVVTSTGVEVRSPRCYRSRAINADSRRLVHGQDPCGSKEESWSGIWPNVLSNESRAHMGCVANFCFFLFDCFHLLRSYIAMVMGEVVARIIEFIYNL